MTFDNLQQADGQTACQVTMTVDGQYPEKWRTIGQFSYLSSSSMFLGGSDGRENVPLLKHINNLVGCLKKVRTKETCTLQLCNIDSLNLQLKYIVKILKKLIEINIFLQVEYTADSISLDLLHLAKDGNDLMTIVGNVEWQCQDILTSNPLPYISNNQHSRSAAVSTVLQYS